jgi:hypothetical protein
LKKLKKQLRNSNFGQLSIILKLQNHTNHQLSRPESCTFARGKSGRTKAHEKTKTKLAQIPGKLAFLLRFPIQLQKA